MSEHEPGGSGQPAAVPGDGQPESAAAAGPEQERAQRPDDGARDAADDQAAARIAELEDQRLRALADLDNFRKKCIRQVSEAQAQTRADVALRWLPVVDNLERALAHSGADPGSIIEGVRAVREQALGVLAGLGFPRRDDLGTRFDPARHEAVATRPDRQAAEGSVVEVLLPAYGDGDRQLRPAQVVVAKAD